MRLRRRIRDLGWASCCEDDGKPDGISRGPLNYAIGLPGPTCIGQVLKDGPDVLLCIGERASGTSYRLLGTVRLTPAGRELLARAIREAT